MMSLDRIFRYTIYNNEWEWDIAFGRREKNIVWSVYISIYMAKVIKELIEWIGQWQRHNHRKGKRERDST